MQELIKILYTLSLKTDEMFIDIYYNVSTIITNILNVYYNINYKKNNIYFCWAEFFVLSL